MEIKKKYQNGFFFVFEFFCVFLWIPWLKNISFDTLRFFVSFRIPKAVSRLSGGRVPSPLSQHRSLLTLEA